MEGNENSELHCFKEYIAQVKVNIVNSHCFYFSPSNVTELLKNGENMNSLCAEEWKDESKVCSDGSQVFSVLYNDNN